MVYSNRQFCKFLTNYGIVNLFVSRLKFYLVPHSFALNTALRKTKINFTKFSEVSYLVKWPPIVCNFIRSP